MSEYNFYQENKEEIFELKLSKKLIQDSITYLEFNRFSHDNLSEKDKKLIEDAVSILTNDWDGEGAVIESMMSIPVPKFVEVMNEEEKRYFYRGYFFLKFSYTTRLEREFSFENIAVPKEYESYPEELKNAFSVGFVYAKNIIHFHENAGDEYRDEMTNLMKAISGQNKILTN